MRKRFAQILIIFKQITNKSAQLTDEFIGKDKRGGQGKRRNRRVVEELLTVLFVDDLTTVDIYLRGWFDRLIWSWRVLSPLLLLELEFNEVGKSGVFEVIVVGVVLLFSVGNDKCQAPIPPIAPTAYNRLVDEKTTLKILAVSAWLLKIRLENNKNTR